MLAIAIFWCVQQGFIFLTDSKRHFPLADKRTEIVIVIFKPDPDAGCDLFVVFRAVSGTAGSKESNGFVRQTGKEVANLEAAGSAVNTETNKINFGFWEIGTFMKIYQIFGQIGRASCRERV